MTMPEANETTPTYQPTPAQIERSAALVRFNWLFIYTPVGLAAAAILTLVGVLLWRGLMAEESQIKLFTSALADIVLIFTILPMMLLCAIVPAAAVGLEIYRRKKPRREYGRVQTLFWRLDGLVDKVYQKIDAVSPRLTKPLIQANARMKFFETLLTQTRKFIKRS